MAVNSNGVVTIGDTTLADFPTSSRGQSQLEVLGSGDGGNNGITAISTGTGGDAGMGGIGVLGYGAPGGIGGIFVGADSADGFTGGGGGLLGVAGNFENTQPPGLAGLFDGDVQIEGTLTASSKDFKIDHPTDPANKYLVHASVESSEMMNIYSGNVTTDELGLATVTLPEWFEALNIDFRYQLTTIGRDAHAWIAEEVANKQFKIATNASRVKVSWQITAVRQDAYAKAHPLVVEEEKPAREKGFYQHPELYGQPTEKQTEWARHPGLMQEVKAQREAAKQRQAGPNKAAPIRPQFGPPASAVNHQFPLTAKTALKPIREGRP
jgi:trimeric autotransporter adhesin